MLQSVFEVQSQRMRRSRRVRAKIRGSAHCPRLSVFRSGRHIYAQLIDDDAAKTLVSSSDFEAISSAQRSKKKIPAPTKRAAVVGAAIAEKAARLHIPKAVFDRGRFAYRGALKSLADAARASGLKF